eukprot:Nk52_evm56s1737 gene=Nk52_evmTU56s1737
MTATSTKDTHMADPSSADESAKDIPAKLIQLKLDADAIMETKTMGSRDCLGESDQKEMETSSPASDLPLLFLPENIVSTVNILQQQRVEAYDFFLEGFSKYIETGPSFNVEGYKKLVAELTKCFNGISRDINETEEFLREAGNVPAAEALRKIQNLESDKLKQTCALQIKWQKLVEDRQNPSENEDLKSLYSGIQNLCAEIREAQNDFKSEMLD